MGLHYQSDPCPVWDPWHQLLHETNSSSQEQQQPPAWCHSSTGSGLEWLQPLFTYKSKRWELYILPAWGIAICNMTFTYLGTGPREAAYFSKCNFYVLLLNLEANLLLLFVCAPSSLHFQNSTPVFYSQLPVKHCFLFCWSICFFRSAVNMSVFPVPVSSLARPNKSSSTSLFSPEDACISSAALPCPK